MQTISFTLRATLASARPTVLLGDNTFCFTFMGGSLDMLVGGRWKAQPGGKGVRLVEERQASPLFPAFIRNPEDGGTQGAWIELDGYSLSRASRRV